MKIFVKVFILLPFLFFFSITDFFCQTTEKPLRLQSVYNPKRIKKLKPGKYLEVGIADTNKVVRFKEYHNFYQGPYQYIRNQKVYLLVKHKSYSFVMESDDRIVNNVDYAQGKILPVKINGVDYIEHQTAGGKFFNFIGGASFVTMLIGAPLASIDFKELKIDSGKYFFMVGIGLAGTVGGFFIAGKVNKRRYDMRDWKILGN
jgi:hypothetical protein